MKNYSRNIFYFIVNLILLVSILTSYDFENVLTINFLLYISLMS